MIKITLAILLISTISSTFLKKVARKEDSCSDSSEKHAAKLKVLIDLLCELEAKIKANAIEKEEFLKKNQFIHDDLTKKIENIKCQIEELKRKRSQKRHNKKSNSSHKKIAITKIIGTTRKLGKTVPVKDSEEDSECEESNSDNNNNHNNNNNHHQKPANNKNNKLHKNSEDDESNCDDDNKDKSNKNKKHHNNSKDDESNCDDKNDKNNHSKGNHSAWGNKASNNTKISGSSQGISFGKGGSSAVAGPQGAQSMANGSKGTSTGSSFKNDSKQAVDAWGVTNNNGKQNAWGTKGLAEQKVDAKAKAQTFGSGNSGSKTGNDGSQTFGKGSKGSKTNASWDGDSNNYEDSFGVTKHK